MKVTILTDDDSVKSFDNVTKVTCNLAFDAFENEIEIHQGKTSTNFKQYQINAMEIE